MALKIFNTLTNEKELFTPLTPGKVRMYVCGVTVYDSAHIGHARSFFTFDIIYRYLKFSGFDVEYVRNFTDVDDKIIKKANDEKVSCETITEPLHRRVRPGRRELWAGCGRRTSRAPPSISPRSSRSSRSSKPKDSPTGSTATCITPCRALPITASCRARKLTSWKPARGSKSTSASARRWISPCGNRASRASRPGIARGVPGGRAGISNVRP